LPRILISTSSFDAAASPDLKDLSQLGFEVTFNPFGRRLSESEALELLRGDVVAVIAGVEPLSRKVLAAAPALKVISRCGTGMDSVDLDASRELGIRVYNTPQAPAMAVAELALGLMLNLLRRVSEVDRDIRAGRWKPLMGNLLAAQTVGIVGYGRIGRRVGELARVFGARVIACDPAYKAAVDDVLPYSLDSLLATADVVSLHLAADLATYHLLDAGRIALMKSGAMLVNTARGGLVDEVALLAALQAGKLGGAAFDTFENEPYVGPLTTLPNVVLTAHMGSYAKESRTRMEQEAVANLIRGLVEKGVMPPPKRGESV